MTPQALHIVVVDQQPGAYDALQATRGEPLQIRFFDCGRDALHIASNEPIDAWMINVRLPDMTGFELHEMLRRRNPGARFVLVGDKYRADDELKARTGAASYLCKPPQSWWIDHFRAGTRETIPQT